MAVPEIDLLRQIVSEYSIGDITEFQRLTLGYVNTSYVITTLCGDKAHKYLLRIYKKGIEEEELVFEHSIINHLVARGFDLTAAVVRCRSDQTYLHLPRYRRSSAYCAIFEFLPGEDRFSWVKPECTTDELAESGAVLARFHDAVLGLVPGGRRVEPKIMELLPRIDTNIRERLEHRRENVFERCLYDNRALAFTALARLKRLIDPDAFGQTLHLVIHGDYHPGNLKFEGSHVVGLFDLDWSKVDARTFDLGLALTYFCASWDQSRPDDYFRLDRAAAFLQAYQAASETTPGLRPLDAAEIAFLPLMCAAGNVYVLEWALRDFYSREVDPQEYFGFLQHHLYLMHWFEDVHHQDLLKNMIDENTSPIGATHPISGRATS